ncbi:hypothetical protein D3C87_1326330 [compost metagenome]
MRGQLPDYGITPFSVFQLSTDVSADLPVQLDQLGIDCLNGLLSGTVNQRKDFIETVITCARGNAGCIHARLLEDE